MINPGRTELIPSLLKHKKTRKRYMWLCEHALYCMHQSVSRAYITDIWDYYTFLLSLPFNDWGQHSNHYCYELWRGITRRLLDKEVGCCQLLKKKLSHRLPYRSSLHSPMIHIIHKRRKKPWKFRMRNWRNIQQKQPVTNHCTDNLGVNWRWHWQPRVRHTGKAPLSTNQCIMLLSQSPLWGTVCASCSLASHHYEVMYVFHAP